MPAQTSMLHVRVDDHIKTTAAAALAKMGLSLSDAVRILLTRVAQEGGLPTALTTAEEEYDRWFKAKVMEALNDPSPDIPWEEAVEELRAIVNG